MICKIFNINERKIIYQYRCIKREKRKKRLHICIKNKNKNKSDACYFATKYEK